MSCNPFITLKNELYVTREKDARFLGNSMFWKHLDKIPAKHVYKASTVEYRSIKLMLLESVLVVVVAILFTVDAVTERGAALNNVVMQQAEFWGGNVDSVTNVDSLWAWLSDDLVPNVFSACTAYADISTRTIPPAGWLGMNASTSLDFVKAHGLYEISSNNSGWAPHLLGGSPFDENILLGTVRVRQVSVLPSSGNCSAYTSICYPPFSDDIQDRSKFVRIGTPSSILDAYSWQRSNITQQPPSKGAFATYPGDGYVFEFPLNASDAVTQLETLREWSWIDPATRAVIVELSVVNSRASSVVNSVILFEFSGSGSVTGSSSHTPIQSTSAVMISLITFAVFTAFSLFVIGLIPTVGPGDYFTYGWNLLDCVVIVLYFYIVSLRLAIDGVPSVLSPVLSPTQSAFMPFSVYQASVWELRRVTAVLSVLVWMRLIKPLALFRPLRKAVRMFELTTYSMTIFLGPFLVVVAGLVLAFTTAVSSNTTLFHSTTDSFYSMFFIFSHSVDVGEELFWSTPELRPISAVLYILYLVVMFVVLPGASVGTAMFNYRTYCREVEEATAMIESDRLALYPPGIDRKSFWHNDPVRVFLYTWYFKIKGVDLILENEEDVGAPDEQTIDLELLPEVVRTKWLNKKAELRDLIEQSRPVKKSLVHHRRGASRFGERMSKVISFIARSGSAMVLKSPRSNLERASTALMDDSKITRVQLQRLLDSDSELVHTLQADDKESHGTRLRAIDVIRKYSSREAVGQKLIFDSLLGHLSFSRERSPRAVKRGLNDAITELESVWKQQLGLLVEAATEISNELLELKELIDKKKQQQVVKPDPLARYRSSSSSNRQ